MSTDRLNDLDKVDPRLVLWALLNRRRNPEEISELREARARVHRACLTAEICGKCGRALDELETVYITTAYKTRRSRYWSAPVCEGCAPRYLKDPTESRYYVERLRKIFPKCPCEECGRTVVFDTTPALWRRRKHILCSKRCGGRYYKRTRDEHADPR